MGKQKIVIGVPMENAKRRSKALTIAVGFYGVVSAQIDGERIVIIGEGIDSIVLVVMLRKKMGFAELISVSSEEKKDAKKDDTKQGVNKNVQPLNWQNQVIMEPQPYMYATRDPYNDSCCIM